MRVHQREDQSVTGVGPDQNHRGQVAPTDAEDSRILQYNPAAQICCRCRPFWNGDRNVDDSRVDFAQVAHAHADQGAMQETDQKSQPPIDTYE